MSIISSVQNDFTITYKVVHQGVYHYKIPLHIKSNNEKYFNVGDLVYVCETTSGYGFGISKQNAFEPIYYDRDSCKQLTLE